MLSLKQRKKVSREPQENIFANRNTLYKRFHHGLVRPNDQIASSNKELQESKYEGFRNRLAQFIEVAQSKQQNGGFMLWKDQVKKEPQRRKIRTQQSQDVDKCNVDQKQSILRHLQRSSQGSIARNKSFNPRLNNSKVRIHTNNALMKKKKSYIESLGGDQQLKTLGCGQFKQFRQFKERRRSMPVCTINFINYKKSEQLHKNSTVYQNYMTTLGYNNHSEQNALQQQQQTSCSNKLKICSNSNIDKLRSSEVIIYDGSEEREFVKYSQTKIGGFSQNLLGQRKNKNKIRINRVKGLQNVVGPWSKKGQNQQLVIND